MRKGPKYRPPSKIDWKECHAVIYDALSAYCKKWCKREKADKKSPDAFLNKCKNIMNIRISYFESNSETNCQTISSFSRIKNKLQKLGTRFVFEPADKATNNVVVVCRKYYIEVLRKEILNSTTFHAMHSSESQIVDRHITATDKLKAPAEHLKVPTMYWLPKLHKKNFQIPFHLSVLSKCTTTKISALLTSALSQFKEIIVNYCIKAYEHTGVNYFWT